MKSMAVVSLSNSLKDLVMAAALVVLTVAMLLVAASNVVNLAIMLEIAQKEAQTAVALATMTDLLVATIVLAVVIEGLHHTLFYFNLLNYM